MYQSEAISMYKKIRIVIITPNSPAADRARHHTCWPQSDLCFAPRTGRQQQNCMPMDRGARSSPSTSNNSSARSSLEASRSERHVGGLQQQTNVQPKLPSLQPSFQGYFLPPSTLSIRLSEDDHPLTGTLQNTSHPILLSHHHHALSQGQALWRLQHRRCRSSHGCHQPPLLCHAK